MQYTEMGSGGSYPFPKHDQDPKVKQENPAKFLLPYAKAAYSDWMGYGCSVFAANNGQYEKYRLYALGKQPIDPYFEWLGIDKQTKDTWMASDWTVRPIVSTYRDKAISRLMEMEHGIVATPIDALAKTEVTDYLNEMKAKLAVRQLIAQTNANGLGNHPLISLQPDDPMDVEELEMRVEMGEQFNRAKDAELAIEVGFYENDYRQFRRSLYEDLFDYGVAGYKEWLGDDGKAKFRKVNPENVVTNFCREGNFRSWGENPPLIHAGELIDVPLVELATIKDKDGNNVFTEEDLRQFAASVRGRWGNPLNGSTDTLDKFKAKVLDLELITYDDYVWKTAPNGEGNEDLRRAEYGRRSDKFTRKRLKCAYKVKWVVGTDKCYAYGLCYDQKRPQETRLKGDTSLSYRFYAYNFHNMKAQGFMERLIPYLDDYQLTCLKIQNFKNRAVPSGWWMDMDALEAAALKKGGKDMTPLQLIQMFMETGVLVGRSHKQDGTPLFTNSAPIVPMNNTAASELQMLYQDLMATVQAIAQMTGHNDVTEGNPNAKMLVPGIESAQLATTHSLFPLLFAETYLSERLAEDVLLRMQQGIRKKGVLTGYAYSLNANTLRFAQLNGDISMRAYGIKLQAKTSDEMKAWLLQQMQGDIANGYLDSSDAAMLVHTHNAKQCYLIWQHRVKKAKEQVQQQEMQKIQEANKGNMEAQQMAQQAKAEEMQLQAQVELQKNRDAIQGEIEKEKIRQQTELEKERMRYAMTLQKTEADNQTKLHVAEKQNEGKVEAASISAQGDIVKTELSGEKAKEKQLIANNKPQPKPAAKK